jgi:predicted alpha/beta superfamily hydrolase
MAQNSKTIVFEVVTKDLDTSYSVYITGNLKELGSWNPSKAPMQKVSDNLWRKTFLLEKDSDVEFKFTLGSWSKEALDKDGHVPQNNFLSVMNDTTIVFKIDKWKDGDNTPVIYGQVTGKVDRINGMSYPGLKSRDVLVWLPPNYESDKRKHYPVLYIHDGQNVFDPKTSTFGTDWQVDETADSLIRGGGMKEIIIVAINNTDDRIQEYSYTELGKKYMEFIVKKLKPYIDKNYRTLPDRKNTATMGSSMGGLISFMLVWEHAKVFSMAGCLSAAMAVKGEKLNYNQFIESYKGKKKDIKVYFDNGSIGLEKRLQPGIDEALALLKERGYKENKDLEWFLDEGADHNEASWAKRVWRPLLFMFGK